MERELLRDGPLMFYMLDGKRVYLSAEEKAQELARLIDEAKRGEKSIVEKNRTRRHVVRESRRSALKTMRNRGCGTFIKHHPSK